MTPQLRQFVDEIVSLTGADRPAMLEDSAPVLAGEALRQSEEGSIYLIGLIGGKDVGKSALVNALVGKDITPQTSFGPGTQSVIAYCHEAQVESLKSLLEREAPGQHRIVTHGIPRLARQVLLDLPDIDSHYEDHIELTRRMLRHMLYPVWMQSVEKYADRSPREMLEKVAAGNDPRNFVFCLNKADQIAGREGEAALREIRDDFAERIARALKLDEPPRVWTISAIQPEKFDLPALRTVLSQQKTHEAVVYSKQLAARQQGVSLLSWIKQQDLPERLARLDRLLESAEEELAERIGQPLVEQVLPQLLDDPALRLAQADDLMARRVARWPVVGILHIVLDPLVSLVRRRLALPVQRGLEGTEELVDLHLQGSIAAATRAESAPADEPALHGQRLATAIQGAFAYLQQSHFDLAQLYAQRKLWEPMDAEAAEVELRHKLAATLTRQREALTGRIGRRGGGAARLWRWMLTLGALLWFPFIQPLLAAGFEGGGKLVVLFVQLLGVTYLLKNVGFLAIYFAALWLILKWDTQRRVDRAMEHWKRPGTLDPSLSLPGQTLEWLNSLVEPIRMARARLAELVKRTDDLREALAAEAA